MGKKRVVLTTAQMDAAIALYLNGVSCRELARRHDTDKGVFTRALKARGIPQRSPGDRNRLYPFNHHAFDAIDNEEAAYWLGFIYADGCVHKRSLSVGLKATDGEHLTRLATFLQCDVPIARSTHYANGREFPEMRLTITHDHLAQRLAALGIIKRRTNLDACMSQIPPTMLRHWIRGLFDGDGGAHASYHDVWRYYVDFVGSHDLIELVHGTLVSQANANPGIHPFQHRCGIWYVRYGGIAQCHRVAAYLYADASIWLPRKRNLIESWQSPRPQ